jgi:hypothetical protein
MCIDCQRDLERSGSAGMSRGEERDERAEEPVSGDLDY